MRLTIILLLLISIAGEAQEVKQPPIDSVRYYQQKISQLHRKLFDSLRNSEEYKVAQERILYYKRKSDSYGSFVLFMDVAQADYDKFNSNITASGFTPLEGSALRFGFGFSGKSNRVIVDIFSLVAGVAKKSTKGSESIVTNFSSALLIDIGYDVIKNQPINIYPYAGLSVRSSELDYSKPAQINPSFTDITNIIQNRQSVSGYSGKLGYQAGVGFDFVIRNNPQKLGGNMLFFKAGINRPVGKENYKIEGVRYVPGIEYGKWIATIGIKFFGRQ